MIIAAALSKLWHKPRLSLYMLFPDILKIIILMLPPLIAIVYEVMHPLLLLMCAMALLGAIQDMSLKEIAFRMLQTKWALIGWAALSSLAAAIFDMIMFFLDDYPVTQSTITISALIVWLVYSGFFLVDLMDRHTTLILALRHALHMFTHSFKQVLYNQIILIALFIMPLIAVAYIVQKVELLQEYDFVLYALADLILITLYYTTTILSVWALQHKRLATLSA